MLKFLKNLVIMIWERMKRKTKGDKSKMNFSLNLSDDLTEEKNRMWGMDLLLVASFLIVFSSSSFLTQWGKWLGSWEPKLLRFMSLLPLMWSWGGGRGFLMLFQTYPLCDRQKTQLSKSQQIISKIRSLSSNQSLTCVFNMCVQLHHTQQRHFLQQCHKK